MRQSHRTSSDTPTSGTSWSTSQDPSIPSTEGPRRSWANPTYASVRDVPGPVDYVVSAVPNNAALDLVDDCVSKGVKALHFFTARFSETGSEEGAQMERDMLAKARDAGMRILGPNCMGLYYPKEGIAWGREFPWEYGNVGIISQSGGNAGEMISVGAVRPPLQQGDQLRQRARPQRGRPAGVPGRRPRDGAHRRVHRGREGRTTVARALGYASRRKPVVLLKGGRTRAGTNMASSHTGSLAGANEVWEAMCRQMGVVNALSMEDLLDTLVAFARMPASTGVNLLVGGGTGGKGVMSADECEEAGLNLLPIPDSIREELVDKGPVLRRVGHQSRGRLHHGGQQADAPRRYQHDRRRSGL